MLVVGGEALETDGGTGAGASILARKELRLGARRQAHAIAIGSLRLRGRCGRRHGVVCEKNLLTRKSEKMKEAILSQLVAEMNHRVGTCEDEIRRHKECSYLNQVKLR